MSDLKIIKIIISSSIEDIESDILEVKAFFGTLNDIYIDWNIFFSIETAAPDSDESLLESIGDSELTFLLFYKKVGDTFRHTFEKAIDMYKSSDKPLIIPYFKYVSSTDDVSEDIKKLQDHLGNDLKHYYKSYNNPDTLKLYMIMQIKQMQLDSLPFEIKDGVIRFDGKELVPADSIPAFANNKHLKELKEKFAEINEKFVKLKAEYLSDPDNEKLEEEYSGIASERAKFRQEIKEHENTLFKSIKTIIKETTKGGLSQRQIEGYKLMESGDYEGALEILNYDDIMSDLDRNTLMASAFIENIQINANELLQRISALEGKGINSETAEEIRKIYEKLHDLIGNYGALDKKPLYDYIIFLQFQNDHERAIEIAEEYLSCVKKEKNNKMLPVIYNHLGTLYCDTQRYWDAKRSYLDALDTIKSLTDEDPDTIKIYQARIYTQLGTLYQKMQKNSEAAKTLLKALYINKKLTRKYHNVYSELALSETYSCLGNLYQEIKKYSTAEKAYLNSLEIREKLTKEHPGYFGSYLAAIHSNLGGLYVRIKEYQKAKQELSESIRIRKKLAQKNPDAFEPALAESYNNLGMLYKDTEDVNGAEEAFWEALEIKKRLAEKSPNAYEPALASAYANIGLFYTRTDSDKAKEFYLNAKKIYERLADKAPDVFEPMLANVYNELGILYHFQQRNEEAKNFFIDSLNIRKRLADTAPDVFEPDLAGSYHDLGLFYINMGKYEKAANEFFNSLKIVKRLAQKYPDVYEPVLAEDYQWLGKIYMFMWKKDTAKKFFTDALTIYKNININGNYDRNIIDIKIDLSKLQ